MKRGATKVAESFTSPELAKDALGNERFRRVREPGVWRLAPRGLCYGLNVSGVATRPENRCRAATASTNFVERLIRMFRKP
jgi:hypothetical protein